jgi:predicted RNA-binding Zn-ribbon protein involved in translation (DUF1610 family)
MDVIVLEKVYHKLEPYTKQKLNYAVLRGGQKFECPNCGKLPHYKSMYTTAAGTIQHRMQCSDRKICNKKFTINNKTYIGYLQFKLRSNIK